MVKYIITKDALTQLYIDKNLKIAELCSHFDCSVGKIYYHIKKYHLPLRQDAQIAFNYTDFEKGYLCGIIDGEGAIYMSRQKHYLHPRFQITTCNEGVIEYLHRIIGGAYWVSEQNKNKHWKRKYNICLTRTLVLQHFLEAIRNGLLVKKEQAELVIEFCELHQNHARQHKHCSEREWQIYEKIRQANRRGTLTPELTKAPS